MHYFAGFLLRASLHFPSFQYMNSPQLRCVGASALYAVLGLIEICPRALAARDLADARCILFPVLKLAAWRCLLGDFAKRFPCFAVAWRILWPCIASRFFFISFAWRFMLPLLAAFFVLFDAVAVFAEASGLPAVSFFVEG
jgi:hypothetical protein